MLSDKIRRNEFCHVDENGRWQKMSAKIIGWKRLRQDPNMISVALDDNWILKSFNVREHYLAKGWCATQDGRVLHYTKQHGLNEVSPECHFIRRKEKYFISKNGIAGSGNSYILLPHRLRNLVHIAKLHVFIYECWYGARTPGMQIDHINGCELDNRICNLQEVTPEENRYRGVVLNAMRSAKDENGEPLYDMAVFEKEPFRLIEIFDKYRHLFVPKTKNDELKLAINPYYDTRNHSHGVVIKK